MFCFVQPLAVNNLALPTIQVPYQGYDGSAIRFLNCLCYITYDENR